MNHGRGVPDWIGSIWRTIALLSIFQCVTCWQFLKSSPNVYQRPLSSENISWQEAAARKRLETYNKIPQQWILPEDVLEAAKSHRKITGSFIEALLDNETLKITSLDPVDILEHIRNRSFTSVQVTTAFCKRSAYGHQLNENLLEIFYDLALDNAKELDAYQASHNSTIGTLHGLPVTLKDQFHVKGVETTMGYVGWIGTFEGHKGTGKERIIESELVRELRSLGAVPIAKTTLAQALASGETSNNILGYTKNPVNQELSCGGSSGGEGAVQALRGSAVGFGTDIGGSVVVPSAFNGVYGFKPSVGRNAYRDAANAERGQTVVSSVVGILGPSLASLKLMFRALMSTEPWRYDHDIVPIPWYEELYEQSEDSEAVTKLSFGILESDGSVSPHPPIRRAMKIAAKVLEKEGHKTITWDPPSHAEGYDIHYGFMDAGGYNDSFTQLALSGEPPVREMMQDIGYRTKTPMPILEYFNLTIRLKDYRNRYADYWKSMGADAVIMPVAPHAAVLPGGNYYTYAYSSIIDALNYCSIVIPVTTADQRVDKFDGKYKPLNDIDKKNWQAYDPDIYDGAPAAVQVIGRRLEEQRLFRIARAVDEALRRHGKLFGA
ncbi:amidase [Rhizodiscina lignyota]|uniref:Amidase n=1 Tax=Rhizodiscina lignyota TaxID=1504668 RepID=A0A9P4IGD5_9PEZI|nr:amidase [Rhizodiscina lignyota]